MISGDVWESVWVRIESVFGKLAIEVKQSVHNLSWECGHNANDVFPFRAYATFRNGTKVVDLSVDCNLSEGVLLISADLAREEGFVLSELPVRSVSLQSNQPDLSREIHAAIAQVEEFTLQQADPLGKELRLQ